MECTRLFGIADGVVRLYLRCEANGMVFVQAANASRPIIGHIKNTGITLPMSLANLSLDITRVTQRRKRNDANNQYRNLDMQAGDYFGAVTLFAHNLEGIDGPAFDVKAVNPGPVRA